MSSLRLSCLLSTSLATVLIPTIVMAQGRGVQLDEIVVDASPSESKAVGPIDGYVAKESLTGTKTATKLLETPQSVTVVGQQQIRNLNEQTIDQTLTYASGVRGGFFGVDTRTDWILIRGFPAQISGYFLDGLQLFSPDFGTFKLEPWGLERVEILKGPASVLYGGSNVGGIINAVSKRPTFTQFGYLETGINNYGNKYVGFDIGGPASNASGNQFYYRLEGYARGGGTQVDFRNDDRLYLSPSLTWAPDAATTFTILSSFQRDRTKGADFLPYVGTVTPAPYGRISTSRYTGEPNYDTFRRDQSLIGYTAAHRFNEHVEIRQNFRYSDMQIDQRTVFGGGYSGQPADAQLFRFNFTTMPHVTELALDNQVETRFHTGPISHTILTGVDYKNFAITDTQGFLLAPNLNLVSPVYAPSLAAPTTAFASYKNQQYQLGEYIQEQARLDRFTLVLSGRHDTLQTVLENKLNPAQSQSSAKNAFTGRAGLIYTSDFGVAPYATYATSFDPQLGFNAQSRQPFVPITGDLKEVGIKYQPRGMNITFDAALYEINQKNVLTSDPTFILSSVQTSAQRSRGFELSAIGEITPGLQVLASYTGYDLKIIDDPNSNIIAKLPTRIPQNFGALFLDYTIQTGVLKGLGAGAGPRYTGASFADPLNTMPVSSYVLGDANIHYDRGPWRAALNVRNFTDKVYVASCSSIAACFYGERLTALASVGYKW